MHLHVIICFALLIWWPDNRPLDPGVTSRLWVWIVAWAQVPFFLLAAHTCSAAAVRRFRRGPAHAAGAQRFYHLATFVLRSSVVLAFLALAFLTTWVDDVRSIRAIQTVPGLADLLVLLPFLCSCAMLFAGLFPIDKEIHRAVTNNRISNGTHASSASWSFRSYLNFNLRHHLFVVVVPMMLVLAAFNLAGRYERLLIVTFRFPWAPEAVPGIAAGLVFVIAPLMLRYIWTTAPLPDGPLRCGLQSICDRVGLRHRDILIWKSGGMMINAAVMGLFPRVRYVLLSDGLLETMSSRQIEAVFGHEAGHIRHRHIPYFLLFALCSMLLLSGVVEALRLAVEKQVFQLSPLAIQAVGLIVAVVVWGVGFGWVSRRFERQADLFGAHCVTPDSRTDCGRPCGLHLDDPNRAPAPGAVCAYAADIFVSALNRVALLNGIPPEERSWRHSSIASRVRFLTVLAGDPASARRFHRCVRRIKTTLVVLLAAGLIGTGLYVWRHPIYGLDAARGRPVSPHPAAQRLMVPPTRGVLHVGAGD